MEGNQVKMISVTLIAPDGSAIVGLSTSADTSRAKLAEMVSHQVEAFLRDNPELDTFTVSLRRYEMPDPGADHV